MTEAKTVRPRPQGRIFPEYTIPPEELARQKTEKDARVKRYQEIFAQVSPKLINDYYN